LWISKCLAKFWQISKRRALKPPNFCPNSCFDFKGGWAMNWILVLYFTCLVDCGPLRPGPLTVRPYATQQECMEAGNMWVKPNANPASFACNYVGPKYRVHPEQYQE
jgi:hypothetical protein